MSILGHVFSRKSTRRMIKEIEKKSRRIDEIEKKLGGGIEEIENTLSQTIEAINELINQESRNERILGEVRRTNSILTSRLANSNEQKFIVDAISSSDCCGDSYYLNKRKFLLFHYAWHTPIFSSHSNLGDYVQTIALKKALMTIFPDRLEFDYWDRDNLRFYSSAKNNEKLTCVMQAWLSHSINFFPRENVNPVWVGTHFDWETRLFLEKAFCAKNPTYLFKHEVGCRDVSTLSFLRKQKIEAYLSRCLTLTLPKRIETKEQTKVVFVNVPQEWESFFPEMLKSEAIKINQRWIYTDHEHWTETYKRAEELLSFYRDKARLVVTTALHVASPCLAMGIPVVLIADNPDENFQRFSALEGLLKPYTLEDLKKSEILFDAKAFDIEDLKLAMLKNLKLSILQSWGEKVSVNELQETRGFIESYSVRK